MQKRNNINRNTHLKMLQNDFEMMQNLSSLGSVISDSNANSEESLTRIKETKLSSLWVKNCFHQSSLGNDLK
jgi:hypothetical protein